MGRTGRNLRLSGTNGRRPGHRPAHCHLRPHGYSKSPDAFLSQVQLPAPVLESMGGAGNCPVRGLSPRAGFVSCFGLIWANLLTAFLAKLGDNGVDSKNIFSLAEANGTAG